MYEVLVNRLGGLSLPRKSVVRLIDRPDMTLDVYSGCKTTIQQPFYGSPGMNGLTVNQYVQVHVQLTGCYVPSVVKLHES